MISATLYTPDHSQLWDDFVRKSRNATFMHLRGYMDYHHDRFNDGSLILRDDKGRTIALLPANISGDTAISHGGLTYGGLLLGIKTDVMTVIEAMRAIRSFYRDLGLKKLIYKAIPTIYDRLPAQEDRYALFLEGAVTTTVNISSTVDLSMPVEYNENTRRNLRKALNAGIEVRQSDDLTTFHTILSELLDNRYDTRPVHTLAELQHLSARFPDNIRLMMAYRNGTPVGGTLLYITDTVTHTQYIAANDEGKACDALTLLFDTAIDRAHQQGKRYFDFGTCNEDSGRYLNTGLIRQKNGLGGRGVIYPAYTLDL